MAFVIPRWRAHNVADWESLLVKNSNGKSELNQATVAILNYLPVIGITEITSDNAVETWCRITLLEAVHGAFVERRGGAEDGSPLFTTKDDVIRHIGIEAEGDEKSFAAFYESVCRHIPSNKIDSSRTAAYSANGGQTLLQFFRDPKAEESNGSPDTIHY
jgi:hypothetical protein